MPRDGDTHRETLENVENGGLRSKSADEYTATTSEFRSFKYNFYALSFGNCNNVIFYNKCGFKRKGNMMSIYLWTAAKLGNNFSH